MKKKIFFLLAFTSIILIITATIYRKNFTHWMVEKYFAEKNIDISFKVNSLNFSGISLSDIILDKKTFIDSVDLRFRSTHFNLLNLESFSIQMENLNIEEMKNLSRKMFGPSKDSKEFSFDSLKEICQFIEPRYIHLEIENFFLKNKETPLGFKLQHEKDSPHLSLGMRGHLESSPLKEKFSLAQWDYELKSNIECQENKVSIAILSLKSEMNQLQTLKNTTSLKTADLSIKDGKLIIRKDNSVEVKLPGHLKLKGQYEKSAFDLQSNSLTLSGLTNLRSPQLGELNLSLSGLSIKKPQAMDLSQLNLKIMKKQDKFFPLEGEYNIAGLSYKDLQDNSIFQGADLSGQFHLKNSIYRISLNLKDETKQLQFSDAQVLYDPKTQKAKLMLNKRSSLIRLNDQLEDLVPHLEGKDTKAGGSIQLAGFLSLIGKSLKGHLSFSGKDIHFSTKHLSTKGVQFSHSLLNYPKLQSPKNQSFKADELSYGPSIKDLNLKYQINSLENIHIALLEAHIEGAELQASNFSANSVEKTMKDFKASIYKLSLEKALKLALGDSVTASGLLDGDIEIFFEGKKPMAKGKLTSQGKGWIRYRKPGSQPPNKEITSTNPMDILEAYLYDFYFDELSINFETDNNYDMKMTLRTQGKNPDYLKGKPLKLNINLEQNLLAAFKAMMLTYNLPDKIKEKIEKMGTK